MSISLKQRRAASLAAAVTEPVEVHRDVLRDLTKVGQEEVPLHLIDVRKQPRDRIDETSPEFLDLVGTIREHGVLQPISLELLDVPTPDGNKYRLIAGERRYRAMTVLAKENAQDFGRISAVVIRVVGDNKDAQVLMKQLIENVVRQDFTEAERARAIVQLKESTGWTWEQVGTRMGMDANRVQALGAIARYPDVGQAIDNGTVPQGLGIAIGQAAPDSEIAGAMVTLVGRSAPDSPLRKDGVLRRVARAAKHVDASLPAVQRVARAAVLVGAEPKAEAVEEWDYSQGGQLTRIRTPIVVLANTALRAVRPRTSTMDREPFAEMLRQTCQETNLWVVPNPDQVASGVISADVLKAVIDELCSAAQYWPTQPVSAATPERQ